MTIGGEKFDKTPLGQATRLAINNAVAFITEAMKSYEWKGQVAGAAGNRVFVNAGSSSNVRVGDVFEVSTVSQKITDPETGAVLGVVDEKLGQIEVVQVKEKFSIGRRKSRFKAKRGDLVKLPER